MNAAAPRIEFLWWRECPSSDRALALLREEVAAAGLDPAAVEVAEVTADDEAERLRFPGSPTIRVGGADVDPVGAEGQPFGLTCRVYRHADGRVSPLPDTERIRVAWRAATEGDRGE